MADFHTPAQFDWVKMMPKGLAPGIYFNLPETIYHADPALSRSDIVNLLDTPNSYWANSWMNQNKPANKKTSDEMEYGSAFHCQLLEPEKFDKRYRVVPIDAWGEGKKIIAYQDYFRIVECIKVLRAGKDSNLFLSNGIGEVTIVHVDPQTGLRYRTRHDYFTPICTTDFKTSRSLHEQHLKNEFRDRGLDVQLRLYKQGRRRFKEMFRAGEADVYGQVYPKFFHKFMNETQEEFVFIFQRKTEPYPFEPIFPSDDTENSGEDKIFKAAAIFKRYFMKHGTKPWPVSEGKMREFSMFYGFKEGG